MRAGYDYNPALQNLHFLILGLTDLTESRTYKRKRFLSQRFHVLMLYMPVKSTKKIIMDSASGEICSISSS